MVGFDEIDLVMDILSERAAVAREVRRYVPTSQVFGLMVRTKLEDVVDTSSGLDPSFLTTDTGLRPPGRACVPTSHISIAY
jgi:hypothetical protein